MFFGVLKTGFLINQKSVRYLRISGIWHFFVVQNANFKNSGRDNLCKLFCPGAVNCLHSIGWVWMASWEDSKSGTQTWKIFSTHTDLGNKYTHRYTHPVKALGKAVLTFNGSHWSMCQFLTPGCVRVTISAVFNALLTRTGQFTFK